MFFVFHIIGVRLESYLYVLFLSEILFFYLIKYFIFKHFRSLFSKTIYLPALVINQKRFGKVMKNKDIKSMIVKRYSVYDKTPFVHKEEKTGTETLCKLMVLKPGSDLKHKEIKDFIDNETVLNVFENRKFELK